MSRTNSLFKHILDGQIMIIDGERAHRGRFILRATVIPTLPSSAPPPCDLRFLMFRTHSVHIYLFGDEWMYNPHQERGYFL